MVDVAAVGEAAFEVISPDDSRHRVRLTDSPFLIGRGGLDNHLAIPDKRISRQCAAVVWEGGQYYLDNRGHRLGVFINDRAITRDALADGDVITFGLEDSFRLVFHSSPKVSAPDQITHTRVPSAAGTDFFSGQTGKLNLLLEATKLLHSQMPLEGVLHGMLDRAITVTDADRALLLEADASGSLRQWLARGSGPTSLSANDFSPSQTAVGLALQQQSGVITEDLREAGGTLNMAQSVMAQKLRAVVAIPLYAMPRANTEASVVHAQRGQFLGVLYLDSQRPAAFSRLDRQILDALAIECASILDNARLLKRELERQRIEQELNIARNIQQALLPRGFRDFPHLSVSGMNSPCLDVGGDYFDVFPIDEQRTAFLIADVSGKGLGAALLTTMLQGALTGMTIGADPARVFQHINSFLCDHADVGRYATMFFGTVDRDGNLEYINAGHPSPLRLRRGEVTEPFTEGSFPVGLIPAATYSTARATLLPGDTLLLFSDGVSEAADPREEMFGIARLQEIMAGQQDAPLNRLQRTIVDAVEHFTDGASQGDDITLLLVRYRAPGQGLAAIAEDMVGRGNLSDE